MPALIVGGKIARENMANRVAGDVMCNVSLCIDLSAPQTLTCGLQSQTDLRV